MHAIIRIGREIVWRKGIRRRKRVAGQRCEARALSVPLVLQQRRHIANKECIEVKPDAAVAIQHDQADQEIVKAMMLKKCAVGESIDELVAKPFLKLCLRLNPKWRCQQSMFIA